MVVLLPPVELLWLAGPFGVVTTGDMAEKCREDGR